MTLIDKGRKLLFTKPEPAINGVARDDNFFETLRGQGRTPPVHSHDQYAGRRREATQAELDDASWEEQPPPPEFDFSAEDARRFRDSVTQLQHELPPIPPAPLPIEGEIMNHFEQIARQIEEELIAFRLIAVKTIGDGLDLAAEVRQRGQEHCAQAKSVLDQAAALRLKYQNFSERPTGEGHHAHQNAQASGSNALGQADGGGGAAAVAGAAKPREAEQGSSVRELHRDAGGSPQSPRLAQRTPEVPPQA